MNRIFAGKHLVIDLEDILYIEKRFYGKHPMPVVYKAINKKDPPKEGDFIRVEIITKYSTWNKAEVDWEGILYLYGDEAIELISLWCTYKQKTGDSCIEKTCEGLMESKVESLVMNIIKDVLGRKETYTIKDNLQLYYGTFTNHQQSRILTNIEKEFNLKISEKMNKHLITAECITKYLKSSIREVKIDFKEDEDIISPLES